MVAYGSRGTVHSLGYGFLAFFCEVVAPKNFKLPGRELFKLLLQSHVQQKVLQRVVAYLGIRFVIFQFQNLIVPNLSLFLDTMFKLIVEVVLDKSWQMQEICTIVASDKS